MESTSIAPIFQELLSVFCNIPFNKMLGLKLTHLDPKQSIVTFNMKPELVGNFLHGILHGGVISSVLDATGGLLAMLSAIRKHPDASREELAAIVGKCSTVDLQISYVNPGKGDSFLAKAWLVKSGNKIAFTRMELMNQEEKTIAIATGTYLIK